MWPESCVIPPRRCRGRPPLRARPCGWRSPERTPAFAGTTQRPDAFATTGCSAESRSHRLSRLRAACSKVPTTGSPTVRRPAERVAAAMPGPFGLTERHAWQSREDGVYATDDGGRTWHRIYRTYAQRVVRLSTSNGVISVGTGDVSCTCRERQLWTGDAGRSWHETRSLGPDFAGSGSDPTSGRATICGVLCGRLAGRQTSRCFRRRSPTPRRSPEALQLSSPSRATAGDNNLRIVVFSVTPNRRSTAGSAQVLVRRE